MPNLTKALCAAVVHYVLYCTLDGSLAENGTLNQTQVSMLSLFFITLFKTSLSACVGLCFVQHLWFILGYQTASIQQIETWFTLRQNLISLASVRSLLKAPLLFLMALFLWCLGIAMIYPPGALNISMESYPSLRNYNLSVVNPPLPTNWNPMMEDETRQYDTLGRHLRPGTHKEGSANTSNPLEHVSTLR